MLGKIKIDKNPFDVFEYNQYKNERHFQSFYYKNLIAQIALRKQVKQQRQLKKSL